MRHARPPHDDVPAAELDLGDLVMRVARTLRRRGTAAYEPYELAPHQARALRVVGHHGTMRLGELAQHLRVAPRSVTDVVDALEERGLVARSPDPTDRRAQVVGLTEEGQALLTRVDAARRAEADGYFARLPERDRAALRRILERLERAGEP
ncbi:MarR family winged helix-turn-helix transcriptional regulator [Phycicoccus endophyticus]|uniref:MarR family winged helix-turn-helix transcriptional regulator n=1 Tax=Phycicoccus endophyticus TaxID=1690220 RepID=UPI001E63AC6D|nr:MarR family transcriptional regulator [Phycicoccus endophyticus]